MTFPLRLIQAVIPKRLHRFMGIATSTAYGKARWMNRKEMAVFLSPRHTGLALSPALRLSQEASFRNLALIAPTGSGKTTRYVIPNLLQLAGSAVVTDPSGEIYRATSGFLARQGFRIQVLQPAEVDRSLRFNPLACFRKGQELRRLAGVLAEGSAGKDPFWTIGATNILSLVLSALVAGNPRYENLANARWLLNHIAAERGGVSRFMAAHLDELGFAEFKAFLAQDEKVIASILSAARAALDLWSDPDIARLTATHSIDIAGLRERPTVIYLIVPEHKIRYFSVILNLFYSACFEHCLSHWDEREARANAVLLPVSFFLDEFGNLGRINDFASVITTLRKRRCSVSLILQEKAQLEALYGRLDAQTIFSGGCGNKLFFPGLDQETCEYLERALGQNTVYDTYFAGISEHARVMGKPLLRADEIRMLADGQAILLSGNERPLLFAMPPYYAVETLLARSKEPPAPLPGYGSGNTVAYLPLSPEAQPELPGMTDTDPLRFAA
jgi:type IV secretory pathway TraG/TraD family ATPase VirD4